MAEPKNPAGQTSDFQKQWDELMQQATAPQTTHWIRPYPTHPGGACPACGYCPHCGRGGYAAPYVAPWNPYPYTPFWYTNSGGTRFNNS